MNSDLQNISFLFELISLNGFLSLLIKLIMKGSMSIAHFIYSIVTQKKMEIRNHIRRAIIIKKIVVLEKKKHKIVCLYVFSLFLFLMCRC
jgi:hypothetical protein